MFFNQRRIASWIVIAFTAFCGIGLINVSFWFGRERWSFAQFKRQQRISLMPEADSRVWDWIKYTLEKLWIRKRDEHLLENDGSVLLSRHRREMTSPEPTDTIAEQVRSGFQAAARKFSLFSWPGESNGHHPHHHHRQHGSTSDCDVEKRPGGSRHSTGRIMGRSQSDPLTRHAHRTTLEDARVPIEAFARNLKKLDYRRVAPNLNRVKHMQFSPSGRWLVVCYRFSCRVFDVEAGVRLPSMTSMPY